MTWTDEQLDDMALAMMEVAWDMSREETVRRMAELDSWKPHYRAMARAALRRAEELAR